MLNYFDYPKEIFTDIEKIQKIQKNNEGIPKRKKKKIVTLAKGPEELAKEGHN